MPKKDSRRKDSLDEKELLKKYGYRKVDGGINAQLDKAITDAELDIKQVKKLLGIKDADIAKMFDFKNVLSYRNSSAKSRIEKGIIVLYKLIKDI